MVVPLYKLCILLRCCTLLFCTQVSAHFSYDLVDPLLEKLYLGVDTGPVLLSAAVAPADDAINVIPAEKCKIIKLFPHNFIQYVISSHHLPFSLHASGPPLSPPQESTPPFLYPAQVIPLEMDLPLLEYILRHSGVGIWRLVQK